MRKYIFKDGRKLRCGFTTGTCAAAAAKAAAAVLFGSPAPEMVSITLPSGEKAGLPLEKTEIVCGEDGEIVSVLCGVLKDAGDDADVTDGMMICAKVSAAEERGMKGSIFIEGGEGVGRVTKPGLDQPPGAAAINSAPREMIRRSVREVCEENGFYGDIFVEISVPGGEAAALKTFNPMLGIEGGISILGTSGIVEPMSDNAVIETVRAEIRMKAAAENIFLAAVPGNYGMTFAREELGLQEEKIVKCSNFIGETLDACWEQGLSGILLAGNAGKLIKLASGIMNTHSSNSDGRIETIIACALEAGASLEVLRQVSSSVTTEGAFSLLKEYDLAQKTMDIAAKRAARHMSRRVRGGLKTGIVLFSSEAGIVSYGGEAEEILRILRRQKIVRD